MIRATSKLGLGLVLLSMILAGCSTVTPEEKEPVLDASTRGVEFPTAEPEPEPEPVVEVIPTTFYFEFDQSILSDEARDVLMKHAERLREKPAKIRLEGHADERGTPEYNMALGERRAEAVRDFLLSQGVDKEMMDVISYGEQYPAAMESDEESWALNRRVELQL
jgi:peptidoglycan-associated lipoprotein